MDREPKTFTTKYVLSLNPELVSGDTIHCEWDEKTKTGIFISVNRKSIFKLEDGNIIYTYAFRVLVTDLSGFGTMCYAIFYDKKDAIEWAIKKFDIKQ